MLPLDLGTPGEGLGVETPQAPSQTQWWAKKTSPRKALTPNHQQHTKAMIISNLKLQMVVAPPKSVSYTLNLVKWDQKNLKIK
jgi:hypothetical protein